MTESNLDPMQNDAAFLRQFIDAFPVLISCVSKDLVYRLNNKACEVWFGLDQDESDQGSLSHPNCVRDQGFAGNFPLPKMS